MGLFFGISYPASTVSPAEFASDIEGDTNTEPDRPSSSESPHLLVPKRRSKRKEVSRKARGVIGKVRGLRRIATDKMAHPTIKIDTNVQTKRGLEDSEVDLGVVADPNSGVGVDEEDIPPFLRQSVADIHEKFDDLEWMQRTRLAEGALSNDPLHRWALETDPKVRARNRYMNVQAWANSRIHLRVPDGECDFINASPITLKDTVTLERRNYIATQGPKLGHLSDFWHMVFHESKEVGVIVMLTQTFESGREKCAQYFPLDTEQASMIFSAVGEPDPFVANDPSSKSHTEAPGKVTLLELVFDAKSRSEIRKLELAIGSESKIVWHFLFAGWADYSKPEGSDRDALLELTTLSASKSSPDNPRIVHCSAGVGRTGTFIALDHLLRELESGQLLTIMDPEVDPIFETVNQMREQRMMMVYNEMQMQFIYEVLREQTDRKLGKVPKLQVSSVSEERSPKAAKLSDQTDYVPPPKPELGEVSDGVATPLQSWSGTPPASDNE
ncbi:uncharacterized protein PFLUO_LOCUS4613 [Penicillium psychrofluorescens]|uniref:uncharacterized protein n=1 Tax=Penicillium psychrofluorescens TaxID=3158075 RepID=UPI003CCDEFFB